jgi:hypothetical protein
MLHVTLLGEQVITESGAGLRAAVAGNDTGVLVHSTAALADYKGDLLPLAVPPAVLARVAWRN